MNAEQLFEQQFQALTGNQPFPWQAELYRRITTGNPADWPTACDNPTGLGKTAVIPIWLLALAAGSGGQGGRSERGRAIVRLARQGG